MRYFTAYVAWFVVAVTSAFGQVRPINFAEYDLDNGLHVILHEDHSIPLVAIGVMYHVGSKDEDPQRTGFAHFFEHLMFEGSEHIERGEYFSIVLKRGGLLNAFTSFDHTYYFEMLPSNELKLGLWLESERMLHAKVDRKGVETQRKVVKEEKRQRYDNKPYGSFYEEVFKRAFTDHPYRWIPIGSIAHLNAADISDYKSFYKNFYVPDNATLVIAGDIDVETTMEWVKQYFSEIPPRQNELSRDIIEPAPLNGPIHDTIYDDIQVPALFECYRMPASGSDDYHAMDMLKILLGGGESSRLHKHLVDQKKLAPEVSVYHRALEEAGLFIIEAKTNSGVPLDELERGITMELDKVRGEKIEARELQKLRNKAKADYIRSNDDLQGIALSLAFYHVILKDAGRINTEIDRYLNVTPEDILRVANKYLVPENNIRLFYMPENEE